MAKLFLKITVLIAIVWLANNALFHFFKLPVLWGIDGERENFYAHHAENYNTLFVGSSLTYRQIDPQLFDSLNRINSISTASFNYGIDGSTPVEIFSIYKHILAKKPKTLKNVLVELDFINNFDIDQMHSLRRKSFFGFAQYKYELPIVLQSSFGFAEKCGFLSFDFVHFIESEFKIGMLKDAYLFGLNKRELTDTSRVKDYNPLIFKEEEQEVKFLNKKYVNPHIKFIQEKKPALLQNTKAAKEMFTNKAFRDELKVNVVYKGLVHEMIALAKEKGINLIFVLPPRLSPTHYKDLLPVYFSIPKAQRIELADANEYPDFYKLEYSYDLWHVTEPGSKIYSAALQKKFVELNSAP